MHSLAAACFRGDGHVVHQRDRSRNSTMHNLATSFRGDGLVVHQFDGLKQQRTPWAPCDGLRAPGLGCEHEGDEGPHCGLRAG